MKWCTAWTRIFFGQGLAYYLIQTAFTREPLLCFATAVIQVQPEYTLFRLPIINFFPSDFLATSIPIKNIGPNKAFTFNIHKASLLFFRFVNASVTGGSRW